ncbi:MAG TPA: NnrS family protein [Burkholderiales bacterium]|nr:NnrS family protein [Burkholderiales bacterium]
MKPAKRPPEMRRGAARRSSQLAPHALFFPAAALYAAVALPGSVLVMTGVASGPAALATPFGHAHEMLLGYALAVVAGNQLPLMARSRAMLLFGLWFAARLAFVARPGPIAFVFDAVFAIALAFHVAPRLFRAAKKLRNQALPLVLSALCASAIAYDVAMWAGGGASPRAILTVIVLLLAALMLFMGGRIIAPAAAGQLYRQGDSLAARVQPRIEALLLATMAAAVVSALLPGFESLLRLMCAAAGALALARLLRWRLWACEGRPDLICLGAGYAWLALGLLATGAAAPGNARTAAVHLITIGALGTLTLNVMANTMLLKRRHPPAEEWIPSLATALVAGATLLRIAAAFVEAVDSALLLTLAAVCWSGGFVLVAWLLLRRRRLAGARVNS